MEMNEEVLEAVDLSFWQLINNYYVEIPKMQRDYAQGRENNQNIEQIRNGIIDSFRQALTGKVLHLTLNFVYGETTSFDDKVEKFIPIDGQQRLTTLFLLHWYIFSRQEATKDLETLKERFSYETRESSKRFCERICSFKIDIGSKNQISKQIKNATWFTGSFLSDPTILSMLVMMDRIHEVFGKEEPEKIARQLKENCPITFLWLPMPDFKQTSDLYIKMNARGKQLSDFEIFKAKFQASKILGEILGENDTPLGRVGYISKYNNEFTQFFYKFFGAYPEGPSAGKRILIFDVAMMNYMKLLIRDDYFALLALHGESGRRTRRSDGYEKDYSLFFSYNGAILSDFIDSFKETNEVKESPKYTKAAPFAKEAMVNSLKKAHNILSILSNNKNEINVPGMLCDKYNKDYTEEAIVVRLYQEEPKDEYKFNLIRYTLLQYLNKFGFPQDEEEQNAYNHWKRFIFNLIENASFESHADEYCRAMVFFDKKLEKISVSTRESVLTAITLKEEETVMSALSYQLEEEKQKALLMLRDVSWETEILQAENYFEDSQLFFLLDLSKNEDDDFDLDKFRKAFSTARNIFNLKKQLNPNVDRVNFEKALLVLDCTPAEKMAHLLQPNNSSSWKFPFGNYKGLLANICRKNFHEKYSIITSLLKRLMDASNVNEKLSEIISAAHLSDAPYWKKAFVKYNLFDCTFGDKTFDNCIHICDDSNDSNALMLCGTSTRAYSMDLKTYELYLKLKDDYSGIKLQTAPRAELEEVGLPRRYIELKNIRVGVLKDGDKDGYYLFSDTCSKIGPLSEEEAIEKTRRIHQEALKLIDTQ